MVREVAVIGYFKIMDLTRYTDCDYFSRALKTNKE